MDKEIRYYYPYCGYKLGFCLNPDSCEQTYESFSGCTFWISKHPVTGKSPQSLYSEEGLKDMEQEEVERLSYDSD